MTDIKIKQGAIITIELPGLEAIRIDTVSRLVIIDAISGTAAPGEPCAPDWRVADLRRGTYGDFHRLRPARECNDADCANSGQHELPGDIAPCSDCGRPVRYAEESWYAIDSGGLCQTCGEARGLDPAQYLVA